MEKALYSCECKIGAGASTSYPSWFSTKFWQNSQTVNELMAKFVSLIVPSATQDCTTGICMNIVLYEWFYWHSFPSNHKKGACLLAQEYNANTSATQSSYCQALCNNLKYNNREDKEWFMHYLFVYLFVEVTLLHSPEEGKSNLRNPKGWKKASCIKNRNAQLAKRLNSGWACTHRPIIHTWMPSQQDLPSSLLPWGSRHKPQSRRMIILQH